MRNEDSQSMNTRKKGIKNFIQSLINHQVFGKDEMIKIFLTEKASFQFDKYIDQLDGKIAERKYIIDSKVSSLQKQKEIEQPSVL